MCATNEQWQLAIQHQLLGVTGAYATVDIPQGCAPGSSAKILASVKTTPWVQYLYRVRDRLETVFDVDSRRTLTMRVWEEGSTANRFRTEHYEDGKVIVEWNERDRPPRTAVTPAPAGTMDPFTVLMLLRGQPLRDGEVHRVPIFSKDAVYDGKVRVARRQKMEALGSRVDAVMLEATFTNDGKPTSVHAEIWLTDDERRLPFMVDAVTRFGRLRGVITSVRSVPGELTRLAAP